MARMVFTEGNLAAFRPLLDHPLVANVLTKAIRITEPEGNSSVHTEAVTQASTPSFKLATRDHPDGVPLHAILQSVQSKVKTVNSMSFANGKISVGYSKPPDDATRAAVQAALDDKATLSSLATQFAPPTDPALLRNFVLNDSLDDFEWLRAFRRFQVASMKAVSPTDRKG